jgi:citrate lyase beta subunit
MKYLRLGASLYVPAIHPELINLAKGTKYPALKSLIIDTEDSITSDDLPLAYENIRKLLKEIKPFGNTQKDRNRPMVFIRVRNPKEYQRLSTFENIENIDGFALPKFTLENMEDYLKINLPGKYLMPILEKDIFKEGNIEKIRDYLLPHQERILSIRVGATDLLSSLGLRRDGHTCIYEIGIMNRIITNLVIAFKPYGFNITGPVWESFDEASKDKLQHEVKLDLLNGLFGKSIVHPWQIDIVQEMYQVERSDYETALKLLEPYSPAVFKLYDRMNEKATHSSWAKNIVEMAKIYGIREY